MDSRSKDSGKAGMVDAMVGVVRTRIDAMIPPISHLGKRLVLSILLMGGLLTLIGTSLQLTLELRRDWHEVENSLDSVRSSHLRSLTEAAWNFDSTQLELQLDSLLTLPWISGASVQFGGDGAQARTLHRGDLALSRDLSRSLPLVQNIGGRAIEVGRLELHASPAAIYAKTLDRLLLVLVTQAIKTFVIAVFILFLVHHLINRHLVRIAAFARALPDECERPPLRLDRKHRDDEIETLVNSLNEVHARLCAAREHERDRRAQLEEEIRARTVELSVLSERLALSLEGGELASWDWNLRNGICTVDAQWTAMLGYQPEQYDNSCAGFMALVHPDDRVRVQAAREAHLQGFTATYRCDFRMRTQDGGYRWIHASGRQVRPDAAQPALRLVGVHQDISARKTAELNLRRVERQLRVQADIIDAHVLSRCFDCEGRITKVSSAYCQRSGFSIVELLGQPCAFNLDEKLPDAERATFWLRIVEAVGWRGEIRHRTRAGEPFWVRATITAFYDEGALMGYTEIAEDIDSHKRLEQLAITDELTGVFNRRHFRQVFEVLHSHDGAPQQALALLLVDIDYFKRYNDHYGHQAGDLALQQVAEILRKELAAQDGWVFRLGGEEFGGLLLLNAADDPVAAGLALAERMCAAVRARAIPHVGNPEVQVVTLSIGVRVVDIAEDVSMAAIYREADLALYAAKHQGRNQASLFQLALPLVH